jgi:hypothetical protein
MKSAVFWEITTGSPLISSVKEGFLLGLFFNPEDGGDMFLCNVG